MISSCVQQFADKLNQVNQCPLKGMKGYFCFNEKKHKFEVIYAIDRQHFHVKKGYRLLSITEINLWTRQYLPQLKKHSLERQQVANGLAALKVRRERTEKQLSICLFIKYFFECLYNKLEGWRWKSSTMVLQDMIDQLSCEKQDDNSSIIDEMSDLQLSSTPTKNIIPPDTAVLPHSPEDIVKLLINDLHSLEFPDFQQIKHWNGEDWKDFAIKLAQHPQSNPCHLWKGWNAIQIISAKDPACQSSLFLETYLTHAEKTNRLKDVINFKHWIVNLKEVMEDPAFIQLFVGILNWIGKDNQAKIVEQRLKDLDTDLIFLTLNDSRYHALLSPEVIFRLNLILQPDKNQLNIDLVFQGKDCITLFGKEINLKILAEKHQELLDFIESLPQSQQSEGMLILLLLLIPRSNFTSQTAMEIHNWIFKHTSTNEFHFCHNLFFSTLRKYQKWEGLIKELSSFPEKRHLIWMSLWNFLFKPCNQYGQNLKLSWQGVPMGMLILSSLNRCEYLSPWLKEDPEKFKKDFNEYATIASGHEKKLIKIVAMRLKIPHALI
jgi:hypothetical protein